MPDESEVLPQEEPHEEPPEELQKDLLGELQEGPQQEPQQEPHASREELQDEEEALQNIIEAADEPIEAPQNDPEPRLEPNLEPGPESESKSKRSSAVAEGSEPVPTQDASDKAKSATTITLAMSEATTLLDIPPAVPVNTAIDTDIMAKATKKDLIDAEAMETVTNSVVNEVVERIASEEAASIASQNGDADNNSDKATADSDDKGSIVKGFVDERRRLQHQLEQLRLKRKEESRKRLADM